MSEPNSPCSQRVHLFLLITALAILIWSGLWPTDRFNWLMETLPAMVGGAILVATYRWFRFTTATYTVAWILSIILMLGGHWTYAQVPIDNWARDAFGLSRNHFDRVGHFFQGVVPAMMARELLLRTSGLARGKWLFCCCMCIALAISASYEIFEWQYAVFYGGQRADTFLGQQGDPWDAQEDMLMALLGAISSLLLLSGLQNRQMASPNAARSPRS